jgi:hypothetical protein
MFRFKNVFLFGVALISFSSVNAAMETTRTLQCHQNPVPSDEVGFMVNRLVLHQKGSEYSIVVGGFGFGVIGMNGDGLISHDLWYGTEDGEFDDQKTLRPELAYQAKSAVWKEALPFSIPVEKKVGKQMKAILHIHPSHFSGKATANRECPCRRPNR